MLLTTQSDQSISRRMQAELAEVESRFSAELLSDLPCVNSLVTHIERYRGKMLRPMLVITSGLATTHAGGIEEGLSESHRVVATVAEMVHMATLVHDDVLDEAQIRRQGATINRLDGNETAVMLGDYLISHAYHLCSSLDLPWVSRMIADTTNVVCEGELLQLANRNNWSLDERTYFEIIRRKTAALTGTCCRLGAMLNKVPTAISDGLYDYGEKLGVAFQVVDDLLDLTGDEETVGKTLGRDLEKGKLTLPVIHCLRSLSARQKQELLHRAGANGNGKSAGEVDAGRSAKVREMIESTASIDYARQWANSLVDEARRSIAGLAESGPQRLLLEMADAVVNRKS